MKDSIGIEDVSREVPDESLGITEDDEKSRRIGTMIRAREALRDIHARLLLIERAMGKDLPTVLTEQPLGDAIDLISDLHTACRDIGGEGGSLSSLKKRVDFAKEVTIPTRMDEEKVKTFNTDRYRVTRLTAVFASIKGGQAGQPQAFEWLRKNDLGEIIKPTVNSSSLSAIAKKMIEDGQELPDDIFSVAFKNSISVTAKREG